MTNGTEKQGQIDSSSNAYFVQCNAMTLCVVDFPTFGYADPSWSIGNLNQDSNPSIHEPVALVDLYTFDRLSRCNNIEST